MPKSHNARRSPLGLPTQLSQLLASGIYLHRWGHMVLWKQSVFFSIALVINIGFVQQSSLEMERQGPGSCSHFLCLDHSFLFYPLAVAQANNGTPP